jgi:hypothetical protein
MFDCILRIGPSAMVGRGPRVAHRSADFSSDHRLGAPTIAGACPTPAATPVRPPRACTMYRGADPERWQATAKMTASEPCGTRRRRLMIVAAHKSLCRCQGTRAVATRMPSARTLDRPVNVATIKRYRPLQALVLLSPPRRSVCYVGNVRGPRSVGVGRTDGVGEDDDAAKSGEGFSGTNDT